MIGNFDRISFRIFGNLSKKINGGYPSLQDQLIKVAFVCLLTYIFRGILYFNIDFASPGLTILFSIPGYFRKLFPIISY